jgi:hypothetical protein
MPYNNGTVFMIGGKISIMLLANVIMSQQVASVTVYMLL